jgi:hypothetical protein
MSDEELIAQLKNSKGWPTLGKAAAARIEALTAKVKLMDDLDVINGEKIEALTAKLAQATWLLTEAAVQLEEGKIKTRRNRAAIIWNLLDEMKDDDAP